MILSSLWYHSRILDFCVKFIADFRTIVMACSGHQFGLCRWFTYWIIFLPTPGCLQHYQHIPFNIISNIIFIHILSSIYFSIFQSQPSSTQHTLTFSLHFFLYFSFFLLFSYINFLIINLINIIFIVPSHILHFPFCHCHYPIPAGIVMSLNLTSLSLSYTTYL